MRAPALAGDRAEELVVAGAGGLRRIAKEGRVYVVGTNICMRGADIAQDVPRRAEVWGGEDGWLSRGNATIVGPDGEILAGPLREQEGILHADLDIERLRTHGREFDPVGHYARPDVFRLEVDVAARAPVRFTSRVDVPRECLA